MIGIQYIHYNNILNRLLKYLNHNTTIYNFSREPEIGVYEYISKTNTYYISTHSDNYDRHYLTSISFTDGKYYNTEIEDKIYSMRYDNSCNTILASKPKSQFDFEKPNCDDNIWLIQPYNESNLQISLFNTHNKYICCKTILPSKINIPYSVILYNNTLYITSDNYLIMYYINCHIYTIIPYKNEYYLHSAIEIN